MSDDIVTRLRNYSETHWPVIYCDTQEAADEIERLQAELKQTREGREAYGQILAQCLWDATDDIEARDAEIERLRAERDRWRKVADALADAGTHPTAHAMALEDYEKAVRGE